MTAVLPETIPVTIGVHRATLEDMVEVARNRRRVVIDEAVFESMRPSQEWLQGIVDSMGGDTKTPPIYSVNTGFGSLAGRRAFSEPADAAELSRRLVLSNASGVGRFVDEEVVRATMFIRIVSLAQGYSGIRPEIISTLADMLNAGVCPAIPEYGSLGASGDLIPLAHVAIVMSRSHTGEDIDLDSGEAMLAGTIVSGMTAMEAAGIERLPLGAKDGLALLNGTSFSAAQAALALVDAQNLLETAQITAAMTLEAVMGFGDAFIDELHRARGQRGQIEVAARMRELLADSTLIDGNASTDPKRQPPQDAYSLRCVPQVFGPIKDTLAFAAGILENEINAATDNPLILPALPDTRSLKAVSGGNFHAEYVAFAADFISIVVTEIGSITERRLFRLDDGTLNRGLPDMLIDSEQTGLDCGYMLPQYLAAAMVSDCKTLAHPDSVDSIPTCANQEDHVSMANNAGRHARQIVENIETVVGVELLMAAQALELRAGLESTGEARMGRASASALALLRSSTSQDGRPVDHITSDVVLYPRVRRARDLVHAGSVVEEVNRVLVD